MAWTVLADSLFTVGKPGKGSIFKSLRDNITALANGDSGAPSIAGALVNIPAGGVGSYVMGAEYALGISARVIGDTLAGSSIRPTSLLFTSPTTSTSIVYASPINQPGTDDNSVLSGTWMLMGGYATITSYNGYPVSLWFRIA